MIVFLSAADTDLLTLRAAVRGLARSLDLGPVRAANVRRFEGAGQVEDFCRDTVAHARLVILRLLGGKNHFQVGFDRIVPFCRERGIPLVAVPGDQDIDPELTAVCTVSLVVVNQIFEYLTLGGVDNFAQMLCYASDAILKTSHGFERPRPMPSDGLYWPDGITENPNFPTIGIVFYRAHEASGDTEFVNAMAQAFLRRGLNTRAVFCYSLKHAPRPLEKNESGRGENGLREIFQRYFTDAAGKPTVQAVVSTLSYTVAELETQGAVQASGDGVDFLCGWNVPVFQAVLCSAPRA